MMRTRFLRLLGAVVVLLSLAACNTAPAGPGGEPPAPEPMIHEDVRVLSEDGMADLQSFVLDTTTPAGAGELRFRVGDPGVDALEPGHVLVSDVVPGVAPYGFMQRIVSKRVEGDEVVFETEQANLFDVFGEADIELDVELTPDDVVTASTYYDGMTISYAPQDELASQASVGKSFKIDFDEVIIDLDDDPSTSNDQLRLDGAFQFDATASAGIDICFCGDSGTMWLPDWVPQLQKMYGKVRLSESIDVTMTGELATGFDERVEVSRIDFGTFTVWVGPVPVVFVISVTIDVGVNGQFEATLEVGATQSTAVQVGIEYTHANGWRDLNEFDSNFDFSPPQITAAASARGYVRPQFNVEIYGLAGPYLYAEAFVEADAELYRHPFWEFSGGVDFGIGFKIDLPIVGKIADYDAKLLGFKKTLATSPNSAPEVTITSPADGATIVSGQLITVNATATDREQSALDVEFAVDGVKVASAQARGFNGGAVNFRTECLDPGSYQLTVSTEDDQGKPAAKTISLVVTQPKPTVEVLPLPEGVIVAPNSYFPAYAVASLKTCDEPDNAADQSAISWTVDGAPQPAGAELFYYVPASKTPGSELELVATYQEGSEADEDALTVTVESVPAGWDPGLVAAIQSPANGTLVWQGDSITLTGTAYDPATGPVSGATYTWEARTTTGSFSAIGTGKTYTFAYGEDRLGAYGCQGQGNTCLSDWIIRLTVDDGSGTPATSEITITGVLVG